MTAASLAGCGGSVEQAYPAYTPPSILAVPNPLASQGVQPAPIIPQASGTRIAILLPLTSGNANLGQALLKAAQLALDGPDAPPLDPLDTAGTPEGAAAAVRQALQNGDAIILGPLTAGETAAAAPLARAAGVPVLAFTNDATLAGPGVWTLGITPGQQVRRLVAAETAQGKTRFAALLPQTPFGTLMNDALAQSAAALGGQVVIARQYALAFQDKDRAAKEVTYYSSRFGAIEAQIREARAKLTPEGRKEARDLAAQPVPPLPYDALLLGENGQGLLDLSSLLQAYNAGPRDVRLLGPALWDNEAANGRLGALAGGWYAAPDPAARLGFDQQYNAKYGESAPRIADLAFDAAAIARLCAREAGSYALGVLARPDGYAGVDGLLGLMPDGHVRRGLAIYEIDRGGSHIVDPAPTRLDSPNV